MELRLRFFYMALRMVAIVIAWVKFGYRFKVAKNLPENYIVLSNHVTDYDPIFVGVSFRRQMHFMASEHIARWGWIYKLMKFVSEPIIRYKGAAGGSAVIEMMRHLRKGRSVCMFAEGMRTWDGATAGILPSTAAVVQKAGCGLVTYKITGGYFVSPRWAGARTRRGSISGAPVNVYTKEQLQGMTVDEIYAAIQRDLSEDAYARQLTCKKRYRGKRRAEKLERLMFICPECGAMDAFYSEDDRVSCTKCGHTMKYDEYGMLSGGKFETVKQFADWQKSRVEADAGAGATYIIKEAVLSTIDTKHIETPVASGEARMNDKTLECGSMEFDMSDVSFMAMHGNRALVFTAGRTYYELIPGGNSNSLKFHLYFEALRNSNG